MLIRGRAEAETETPGRGQTERDLEPGPVWKARRRQRRVRSVKSRGKRYPKRLNYIGKGIWKKGSPGPVLEKFRVGSGVC